MLRALVLLSVLLGSRIEASAQGISFVTRRTSTLERQQRARSFFDAAGATVNTPPGTMPEPPPTTLATTTPGGAVGTSGSPALAAGKPTSSNGRAATAAVRVEGAPGRSTAGVLPPVSQRAQPFAVRAGTRVAIPAAAPVPAKATPPNSPPQR